MDGTINSSLGLRQPGLPKASSAEPRTFFKSALLILIGLTLLSSGCAKLQAKKHIELGTIYDGLAQLPDNHRNPVIVVPGILGSRLIDTQSDNLVWGELGAGKKNPFRADALHSLALPMSFGVPLHEIRDTVTEDGPLDELTFKLFGIPIRVNAYAQILASMGVGGYRDQHFRGESRFNEVDYGDEHFTCFQFSYDWRRDVSESAAELDRFVHEKEEYIRQQYRERYGIENADIKFDIVAHSMGGLVTRYFLRYGDQPLPDDGSMPNLTWEGSEHVGRVILVGTPNGGSTQAIAELVEGMQLTKPLPKFPPAVIGTMPAVYQLLPRPRHNALVSQQGESLDFLDPMLWQQNGWGLADPKQDRQIKNLLPANCNAAQRRQIALDHQAKCLHRAKQFHQSLDFPATPPDGVELHLYAGDAKLTLDQLVVGSRSEFDQRIKKAGDGTVTRTSAVMVETGTLNPETGRAFDVIPWTHRTFISSDHIGLTKDRTFVNNVLSLLLEQTDKH